MGRKIIKTNNATDEFNKTCKCSCIDLNLNKLMQRLVMMAKLVKSMHMISKYRTSRISQSRNIVTADIIDKIIETDINSLIKTMLRKITY